MGIVSQRKVAKRLSKLVKRFWGKIDKFVIHKHRAILEAKHRTAMDGHLAFLVGQSERYSQMLKRTVLDVDPTEEQVCWVLRARMLLVCLAHVLGGVPTDRGANRRTWRY